MKRPRYIDFRCPWCRHESERLVETDEDGGPLAPEICNELVVETPAGDLLCDGVLEVVPNLKIGDVLGRTKYPVEEEVIRA